MSKELYAQFIIDRAYYCVFYSSFQMAWEIELNETLLDELYVWIDSIPLSKPKKRIERDFSDGD